MLTANFNARYDFKNAQGSVRFGKNLSQSRMNGKTETVFEVPKHSRQRSVTMKAMASIGESEQEIARGKTESEVGTNVLPISEEKVDLSSLSDLTGFPLDFIKTELLLKEDQLSMGELRRSMASYLENTNEELVN